MENARNILNEYKGTGVIKNKKKTLELVDTKRKYTGIYVDNNTGKRLLTSKFTIRYDTKGTAHVIPAHPSSGGK